MLIHFFKNYGLNNIRGALLHAINPHFFQFGICNKRILIKFVEFFPL